MNRLLVVHVVYRFDIGGLETVLVNLINTLPMASFRHKIIALTDASSVMIKQIQVPDVEILCLNKPEGNYPKIHLKIAEILLKLKPDIVHTYNIATLEFQFIAWLFRVPKRIHAEHGRDIFDIDGSNKKYLWLRRILNAFIHIWIPVSKELNDWLIETVKIGPDKVRLIYNGIDLERFHPRSETMDSVRIRIGTVGRLAPVKDQRTLIQAIVLLCKQTPQIADKIEVIIVGEGEMHQILQNLIEESNLQNCVHLLGARTDVDLLLQTFDVFVLSSLSEGIALTLLEAMANALPVVATDSGGNPELISDHKNGRLFPVKGSQTLADILQDYIEKPKLRRQHGKQGRKKVEQLFSLQKMTDTYCKLYRDK
jgi:sugar transferase (PEP-CTERM/EpsH1 system associated)